MSAQFDLAAALKPYADFAERFGAAIVKSFTDLMATPGFQALARLAEDPEFMAALEASSGMPRRRPCHCFCGHVHPGRHVCDGSAVTTVPRIWRGERIDVATCAPCAAEVTPQRVTA